MTNTDPDDVTRLKLHRRLHAALTRTMQDIVMETDWTELGNALTAVKAQKELDRRNTQLDKEAQNG